MTTFEQNQCVTWIRDSWYGTFYIPAVVVKVNRVTVRISAEHKDGTRSLHNVKPENLKVKECQS